MGEMGEVKAQAKGELNSGLDRLASESKKLCSIINGLTGKLAPVMRAIGESPQPETAPTAEVAICSPAGVRIDSIRRNIVDGIREAETIMRYLEV